MAADSDYHKGNMNMAEHDSTWRLFMRVLGFSTFIIAWLVAILVATLALHLPVLPTVLVVTLGTCITAKIFDGIGWLSVIALPIVIGIFAAFILFVVGLFI